MTEREIVLAAVATAVGAALAVPVSLTVACTVVAALVAAVAFARRGRALLVIVGLMVAASMLGARSESGLARPAAPVVGRATVRTDPERRPGGVVVELGVGGRRYRSYATGEIARSIAGASVGDEFDLRGTTSDLAAPWEWRASRHLCGRLALSRVGPVRAGPWWWRSATWIRGRITAGVASLDPAARSLFGGVVLGDDADQTQIERYRFRVSGLSHLLAVSGQNVAFLLVAAAPLLTRLRLRTRWAVGVALVVWFAIITRLEPSVLRAAAMAVVAATATALGRYVTGLRVVSIAVIGLMLVDPLLVWSTGFRLSVSASVALVVCSRPLLRCLQRHLGGPDRLLEALAVTLAAQVGTAPMLVTIGGSVPLLGPVFNLLAVPVAGVLMVYGVVTAPLAGIVGGPLARFAALPDGAMCRWLSWVARVGSSATWPRVGTVGAWAMVLAIVIVAIAGASGQRPDRRVGRIGVAVLVICFAVIVFDVVELAPEGAIAPGIAAGAQAWVGRSAAVMVLSPTASDASALSLLARSRVARLDLVVVLGGGRRTADAVWALRQAAGVGVVLARDPGTVAGAVGLVEGIVGVGDVAVAMRHVSDRRWDARAGPRRSGDV